MLRNHWKRVTVALLVAGAATTGAGVLAFQDARKEAVAPAKGATEVVVKKIDAPAAQKAVGDRSEEALAREALKELNGRIKEMPGSDIEPVYRWSIRLLNAVHERSATPQEQIAAAEGHLDRMREIERLMTRMTTAGQARHVNALEWQFRRLEAERMLATAQAMAGSPAGGMVRPVAKRGAHDGVVQVPGSPAGGMVRPVAKMAPPHDMGGGMGMMGGMGMGSGMGMMGGMGMGGGMGGRGGPMGMMGGMNPEMAKKRLENAHRVKIAELSADLAEGNDVPEDQAIHKKLGERIAMAFPNETPLEDVLKYIKSATSKGDKDPGIPIYVDPDGLKEAEKTIMSCVRLDLQGVPLRTSLRLALKQLGLAYCVKDGVLIISSVNGIYQELIEALGNPEDNPTVPEAS